MRVSSEQNIKLVGSISRFVSKFYFCFQVKGGTATKRAANASINKNKSQKKLPAPKSRYYLTKYCLS